MSPMTQRWSLLVVVEELGSSGMALPPELAKGRKRFTDVILEGGRKGGREGGREGREGGRGEREGGEGGREGGKRKG